MNKYSDKIQEFKDLFGIEYDKIKEFKTIKQFIEDYEINIKADPLYALNHLMLYAINEIFEVLEIEVLGFQRSGSRNDSDGEFHHYFLQAKNCKYYEVMFSVDDESEEFYEMYEVKPYEVKAVKFKRI